MEEEIAGIKERQRVTEEHFDEWMLLEERRKSTEELLEKQMEMWMRICN